jgi:hypothetical protein
VERERASDVAIAGRDTRRSQRSRQRHPPSRRSPGGRVRRARTGSEVRSRSQSGTPPTADRARARSPRLAPARHSRAR